MVLKYDNTDNTQAGMEDEMTVREWVAAAGMHLDLQSDADTNPPDVC